MDPLPPVQMLPTIQEAITHLLTVYEPEFIRFGYSLFVSFALILLCWEGIHMMFSHDGLGDHVFALAKLLLSISFAYAMIAYYDNPLPGLDVSFSNLITDQAAYFQNVLETNTLDNVDTHLEAMRRRWIQPDAWALLPTLLYFLFLGMIGISKLVSLAIVSFGLVASAICGLLGPIFVPFILLPRMDWLYWSWLKSFIQYSFVPVVALAFLMTFEQVLFRYLTILPPVVPPAQLLEYSLQAVGIIGTFTFGMLLVPSLTNSIFSGHSGESILSAVRTSRLLQNRSRRDAA